MDGGPADRMAIRYANFDGQLKLLFSDEVQMKLERLLLSFEGKWADILRFTSATLLIWSRIQKTRYTVSRIIKENHR